MVFLFILFFSLYIFLFFYKESAKKAIPSSRQDCLQDLFYPIVQALAPCLAVGCCAVIGLAPRALFIGWYYYINETPFQLLIAVILSAQCTDKRVNMVTPALFHDYPTPEALASATPEVIFEYVRSISYPNNKAKHLVGMAQMLIKDFNGEVPDNLDDLVKLPGVGRKTANVMQAVVWGRDAMPVDTHVFRVSHRIGLVPKRCTTPYRRF